MDVLTQAMQCKARHAISLKPDATISDARDLILLSDPPEPWTLFCTLEK